MAWFSHKDLSNEQVIAHKIAAKEIPNYLNEDSKKYQQRKIELVQDHTLTELKSLYYALIIPN